MSARSLVYVMDSGCRAVVFDSMSTETSGVFVLPEGHKPGKWDREETLGTKLSDDASCLWYPAELYLGPASETPEKKCPANARIKRFSLPGVFEHWVAVGIDHTLCGFCGSPKDASGPGAVYGECPNCGGS